MSNNKTIITGVNFNPRDKKQNPTIRFLLTNTPYTEEEWQEYHSAKAECESKGQIWKEVRSPKHDEMAKAYRDAILRFENSDL